MREQIGRYRIIREIGHGAMGRVWLAHDEVIKRNVAVKEMLFPQGMDEREKLEAIERFEREAQAAGSLSHPNIVTVFNVEEVDGVPFIVMEYLEGATLAQVMKEGPLSVPRAVTVMAQLCDALHYAHQHKVVHRDIKPENIFLLYDGRLKVTDFGIARVMGTATVTQIGTVMGTPGYMSPEQVRGEPVDWRTDIFSAGVLLYEMLTGRNPFEADTPTSVMYKVVHEDPPPLQALNPELPAYLQAVINKACAKDRDSRYQDALELKRDLEAGKAPPAPAVALGAQEASANFAPPVSPQAAAPAPAAGPAAPVYPAPAPSPVPSAPPLPSGPPLPSAPPTGTAVAQRRSSLKLVLAIIIAGVLIFAAGLTAIIIVAGSSRTASSEVEVPDLVGLAWEKARSLAEEAGLEIEKSEVSTNEYEEGTVISQSPSAGEKAEKGAVIGVEVAVRPAKDEEEDGTGGGKKEERDLSGMATISASSILSPDAPGVSYVPQNLVDMVNETCWAEGAPGYGIGEKVTYSFAQEVTLTRISCIPGYLKIDTKGQDRWLQNGRLKTVSVSFDDGTQVTHTFADTRNWQDINFGAPKKTRNVTITILDVYPGQSGPNWKVAEDTSVSELHLWGY